PPGSAPSTGSRMLSACPCQSLSLPCAPGTPKQSAAPPRWCRSRAAGRSCCARVALVLRSGARSATRTTGETPGQPLCVAALLRCCAVAPVLPSSIGSTHTPLTSTIQRSEEVLPFLGWIYSATAQQRG